MIENKFFEKPQMIDMKTNWKKKRSLMNKD